ncbi:hypothetical protein EDC96DRAFT_504823 [Choanephora cucurbitarum]|nr:hypothetical protein EDC96DRAFT_504823 [Choanephora cucurbitarum]
MHRSPSAPCLGQPTSDKFHPQAADILSDEDLLELFRIIKHIVRKKPDAERLAKLYFCMAYAMGEQYQFYKPIHDDTLVFREDTTNTVGKVQLPASVLCCHDTLSSSSSSSNTSAVPQRILSVSYLTNPSPSPQLPQIMPRTTEETEAYVRPYMRPLQSPWSPLEDAPSQSIKYPHLNTLINTSPSEVLMEPKQRGFYYQDGRISREPVLLQRYAEQGVLTQANLMKKRKKPFHDPDYPYELSSLPTPVKKPKIPHRHGEFKQRRDDIISRMRTIMMADLEQKAQRLPADFTLSIEKATLPHINPDELSTEEASQLLAPALRILTEHSNMKPHLDNGMNQNGIYYNNDYFRLYLAFTQFQDIFAQLFPNEVIKMSLPEDAPSPTSLERDKDRERNANMKAYRGWIEPYLTETNWAAFRRNIMVGERIMQLTKVVGQGVLLMTKELSGSKLHLTFTNNEWDEFIQGLSQGAWDETIDWSHEDGMTEEDRKHLSGSLLVHELRLKFATHFWFTEEGRVVPPAERKAARAKERQNHHK